MASDSDSNSDSKTRFSNRVEDYVRYRPSYPAEVVTTLQRECGLTASSITADIGAGTGILSQLFLSNGNTVYAVEPNERMRHAATEWLGGNPQFHAVAGSAEETTLAASSVDFVAVAQAFHWFDRAQAKREFARILRPGGWIVLLWNDRDETSTPFAREYEDLLVTYGKDYLKVKHRNISENDIAEFFGPAEMTVLRLSNFQEFDLDGLLGRLRSSSYVPAPGERNHEEIMQAARDLFARYQVGGQVRMEYETVMYFGQVVL
jgi:SAM-dependent methyltransferase